MTICLYQPKILQEGIDKHIANAILIKFNQIGTLSETLDAIYLAKKMAMPPLSHTAQVRLKTAPSLT